MKPLLTAAEMRSTDLATIETFGLPGMVLMERAALGVTQAIVERHPCPGKALCIAGGGNNGGDALAVARQLHQSGWSVFVLELPEERSGDSLSQLQMLRNLPVTFVRPDPFLEDPKALAVADLWVDGLFGIGLKEPTHGRAAQILETLHHLQKRCPPRWGVWSIDLPSGVRADTGETDPFSLSATVTLACGALKWGHVLPPALDFCGEVHVVDIGIPDEVVHALPEAPAQSLSAEDLAPWLHLTPGTAWKGSRGHVVVVAGSDRYAGAAALTCRAALRTGAGLVTLVSSPACAHVVRAHTPEVMSCAPTHLDDLLKGADAVAAGPGLENSESTQHLLEKVVRWHGPRVLDATALHWLARRFPEVSAPHNLVLTPHPGELAALLQTETSSTLRNLPEAAKRCAERYQATCVVKTAGALVASVRPPLFHVATQSPGAGVSGSGDVLTGAIASLLVHHVPERAAALATWLHTRAAALATHRDARDGLLASEIVEKLPHARTALARYRASA